MRGVMIGAGAVVLLACCGAPSGPRRAATPAGAEGSGAFGVAPPSTGATDVAGSSGDLRSSAEAAPAGSSTSGGASGASPSPEPVLAADSAPPGVRPLDAAERRQLEGRCAKLVSWARRRVGRAPTRAAATAGLLAVLPDAPAIAGVDVPACRALLERDLRAYLARTREIEAVSALKMLMLAMSMAVARSGKLCPSAPPVPAGLGAVASAPYQGSASDWQSPGWRCLERTPSGPQRFQYEVKSEPGAGRFEIVARGYPVADAPPTTLFVRGQLAGGKLEPSSEVWRR